MQTMLFKVGLTLLVLFVIVLFSGDRLNSLYGRVGEADQIHSGVLLGLLFLGVAAVSLAFIRTLIGILLFACVVVAAYLIYHYRLLELLK